MAVEIADRFWHGLLNRPFRLKKVIDQGEGTEIYLLHGLGSNGKVWNPLALQLRDKPYRVVSMDLLGFGTSPKPEWLEYNVDNHARAVISFIKKNRKSDEPIIIVGHSMGCLVAVRVAKLKPELVKKLILYQMPLYAGLPESKRYTLRKDLYFRVYNRILANPPRVQNRTRFRNAVKKLIGLDIDPETWTAFSKSLRSTIMEQRTLEDMASLNMPIDVIYGRMDMVVIRGNPLAVFKKVIAPMQVHRIAQMHSISIKSSKFIAKRIMDTDKLVKS